MNFLFIALLGWKFRLESTIIVLALQPLGLSDIVTATSKYKQRAYKGIS